MQRTPTSKKWQTFLIGGGVILLVLLIARVAFLRLAAGADDTTLNSGERVEGRLEPGQASEAAKQEAPEPPEGTSANPGGEP